MSRSTFRVLFYLKLDVRRNMARYVLSNSKPFGLLPKTLPHSANLSLRSRENNRLADKNDFLRTILIANNFLVVIDMYISYLLDFILCPVTCPAN